MLSLHYDKYVQLLKYISIGCFFFTISLINDFLADEERELKLVNQELRKIDAELRKLNERKEELNMRKEILTDSISLKKSELAACDDKWEKTS